MSIKSATTPVINAVEEVVKVPLQEVKNQVSPMTGEMLRMLYWSGDTDPASPEELSKKSQMLKAQDSHNLAQVREKYAELISQSKTPPEQSLNTQTQRTQGNNPAINNMRIEHHREAQELGVEKKDTKQQQEAQKKQEEENEKLIKEKKIQESMENPIEAPAGKQTGGTRKNGRARAMKRLQKPQRTSENRAGQATRE